MTNLNFKNCFLIQSRIIPLSFLPTSGLFCKDATHIESEPHWFPVWSFPLEHIHLSGCRVAQLQPASTGHLHWLASGILWRLHALFSSGPLGSVSGHEMILPRLVLRTQPQNSTMPMLLFLWLRGSRTSVDDLRYKISSLYILKQKPPESS